MNNPDPITPANPLDGLSDEHRDLIRRNLGILRRRAQVAVCTCAAHCGLIVETVWDEEAGILLNVPGPDGTMHAHPHNLSVSLVALPRTLRAMGADPHGAGDDAFFDDLAETIRFILDVVGASPQEIDGPWLKNRVLALEPHLRTVAEGEVPRILPASMVDPGQYAEIEDRIVAEWPFLTALVEEAVVPWMDEFSVELFQQETTRRLWLEGRTLPGEFLREIDRPALEVGSEYGRLRLEGALARLVEAERSLNGLPPDVDAFGIAHRAIESVLA